MANQEHLNLLSQGKDAWNAWREKYPDIQPELSQAYLSELGPGREIINGINLTSALTSFN